jgi:hypothetical protein
MVITCTRVVMMRDGARVEILPLGRPNLSIFAKFQHFIFTARNYYHPHLISYESLCLLKIMAKDRMAPKKAILVSTMLRKLVRTLAWISWRHQL